MPLRRLLCAALLARAAAPALAAPAASPPLAELCRQAGTPDCARPLRPGVGRRPPQAAANPPRRACPADWQQRRTGGCWARTKLFGSGEAEAYVHPRGWVVDPACFSDARFGAAELLAALDTAAARIDPARPIASGGCLGEYNPAWGRRIADAIWSRHMHLRCPSHDAESATCADHEARDAYFTEPDGRLRREDGYYRLLSLRNARRCLGSGGSGLAGVLFHETLHGAGADNFSTEKHNRAWELEQWVFVQDRVYGAEATCFFGVDPALRPLVNIMQCRNTVKFEAEAPRLELCDGYAASFTNLRPQGFLKH